jgi:hypothetical protein
MFDVGWYSKGAVNATLHGFANMWTIPATADLSEAGGMSADDAFIHKEYIEIFDVIRKESLGWELLKTSTDPTARWCSKGLVE